MVTSQFPIYHEQGPSSGPHRLPLYPVGPYPFRGTPRPKRLIHVGTAEDIPLSDLDIRIQSGLCPFPTLVSGATYVSYVGPLSPRLHLAQTGSHVRYVHDQGSHSHAAPFTITSHDLNPYVLPAIGHPRVIPQSYQMSAIRGCTPYIAYCALPVICVSLAKSYFVN